MVNDSCVRVRALSAGLLGDFHITTSKFLDQTLGKKLMSHLKVRTYWVARSSPPHSSFDAPTTSLPLIYTTSPSHPLTPPYPSHSYLSILPHNWTQVVKSEDEHQREPHQGGGSMDWDSGRAQGTVQSVKHPPNCSCVQLFWEITWYKPPIHPFTSSFVCSSCITFPPAWCHTPVPLLPDSIPD